MPETCHARCNPHASLYDQTRSVFADYGVLADWDWRVRSEERVMTQACQFDESDLNYLARRWAALRSIEPGV